MPAKFIVSKGRSGRFGFVLTAANGSPIIKSSAYETKREALTALRYIQRNGDTELVEDHTVETASAPRKTPVGRTVAKRAGAVRKNTSAPRKAVSRKSTGKPATTRKAVAKSKPAATRTRKAVSAGKPTARRKRTPVKSRA
ncbi:DUF1508 domain-containing protein [Embleya sp. AB8]|uniref:YegP family protein n=1 Tax=Embleya sp. AB8 TaxID=3156304 RepID=UPI003C75FFD6